MKDTFVHSSGSVAHTCKIYFYDFNLLSAV